jgi:hypothetical protein
MGGNKPTEQKNHFEVKIALFTLVCDYASLFGAIYTNLAIIERLQQTLIGKKL